MLVDMCKKKKSSGVTRSRHARCLAKRHNGRARHDARWISAQWMLFVFSGIGLFVSIDLGFRSGFGSRRRWRIPKVVGMVTPHRIVVFVVFVGLVVHQIVVARRFAVALNRRNHALVALVTGPTVGGGIRHGMNRRVDGRERHVSNRGWRCGWIVGIGSWTRLLLRL